MSLLTTRQKLEFKRNGFLAVADAVDDDLVTEVREAIWDGIDADPEDPASQVGEGYDLDVSDEVDRPDLFERVNAQVFEYAEDLVGDDVLSEPGENLQFPLKYPDENQVLSGSEFPDHGHIDGYGPGFQQDGRVHGFTIGVAVYYDRVQPRGGGFTVWPGSHWTVAEYYASHVLETPGHAHGDSVPAPTGDPHEITGDAGTVVLWHNKLVHTGGVNRSRDTRLASISRFRRSDFDEIQRDAADKLWKYWPALEDVTPDAVDDGVVPFMRETYGDEGRPDDEESEDEREETAEDESSN